MGGSMTYKHCSVCGRDVVVVVRVHIDGVNVYWCSRCIAEVAAKTEPTIDEESEVDVKPWLIDQKPEDDR